MSSLKDFAEYPFSRHDTVSHGLIDGASVMTFFSDLGKLQYHIIALKPAAYGKGPKIIPIHYQIFPEITKLYLSSSIP